MAYIKKQKEGKASHDATASNFLIRVVRDNLKLYGVLDGKNRVQGNWLDSEAFERKDKRRHTTTASKGATFGVGLNLKIQQLCLHHILTPLTESKESLNFSQ